MREKVFLIPKQFYRFLRDLWRSKELIVNLAKNDFKTRYSNNYLGILWAFVQPVATILIFWFVFEVGFKSAAVMNFPFILWLSAGIIPWFFVSDAIQTSSMSIIENSFLVKKVVFRVSTLPMVKIISALAIHLFFVVFLFGMFMCYGYMPTIYWIQFIYYAFAMFVFLLGLSWITASVMIFFRDLGQIISLGIQLGFWITPIFWNIDMLPEKYQVFMKLNPVYYLTDGYRQMMIHGHWFFERPQQTIYFWCVTIVIFVIGALMFRRLRPHFADVL